MKRLIQISSVSIIIILVGFSVMWMIGESHLTVSDEKAKAMQSSKLLTTTLNKLEKFRNNKGEMPVQLHELGKFDDMGLGVSVHDLLYRPDMYPENTWVIAVPHPMLQNKYLAIDRNYQIKTISLPQNVEPGQVSGGDENLLKR